MDIDREEIHMKVFKTLVLMVLAAGCAVQSAGPTESPQPQPTGGNPPPARPKGGPAGVERPPRVLIPPVAKKKKPPPSREIKIRNIGRPPHQPGSAEESRRN